jgi:hypothetical protein
MEKNQFPELVRWFLWLALMTGVGAYFLILQFITIPPESEAAADLKNPFYVAGLLAAIASLAVKHFIRSRSNKEGKLAPFAQGAFIFSLSLAEVAAILGLVLGLLGGAISDYIPLFAVSLVNFLMINPRSFFV